MRAIPTWVDKVQDREKAHQCIYSLCFKPDGSQLVVAAGLRVLVYDTRDGSLIQPLKGHKDTVYCVCYAKDGRRFASGGADKCVIIWTSKLEGILKYSHNDALQCLTFNPVSHHLTSCAISDFGLWSSEQKSVQKYKSIARINTCAWTNDGQYLALGLINGTISIRNKVGEEKGRIELSRGGTAQIWALQWNPSKMDACDVLCVTDWSQTMTFYSIAGKMVGKERSLGYDPLCVSFFSKGDYLLVSGSNKACTLYTRDGVRLATVAEQQSWVWSCAASPDSNFVAVGCQDGTLAYYQVAFTTVHGLYREKYAYRENMTDVIIQHLLTEQKVRIKCRDLVKKIAIYKHRLAVQLPEKVIIYEMSYLANSSGMHYKVKDKINKKLDCNLLVVSANHLVLCQEKKLQCLNFQGVIEREWEMESLIRYIKMVGGPPNKEGLLVGLKNGQVLKVFLNNAFPVYILKVNAGIRCLDLSASRKKLAVVDECSDCHVYDTETKELLFKEPNASSVAWNSNCEDMLCFSGNNILSIKVCNFPVHQQKLQGFVVGLCGSKIFCLNIFKMTTIEVPLSAPMYQYLEKKMFRDAYKVACLGVTDGDWLSLAHAAMEGLDFDVAKHAFMRIKNLKYLELIQYFGELQRKGNIDGNIFLADILAYRGEFKEAAKLYQTANQGEHALNMYTDLRMFDAAQEFLGTEDVMDRKTLIRKKADWACNINEPRAAAEMYLSAGDVTRAIEVMAQNGWVEMLLDLGYRLTKDDGDALMAISNHLKRLGHLSSAAEMYMKVGDKESVLKLWVDAHEWKEAFVLAEKQPDLLHLVYVPYAQWLAENDRFIEAQKAFHKAGLPEEAVIVLQQLTSNAVNESRYQDAGYYNWILAMQSLDLSPEKFSTDKIINNFNMHQRLACIYYAFETIKRYFDEPFYDCLKEALFNTARFLIYEIGDLNVKGVSMFLIYYTLAKQAKDLGAYKLAQLIMEKIHQLKIPPRYQIDVDLETISIRSKPLEDNIDLEMMCYKCSNTNLFSFHGGNCCPYCGHAFVYSFVSFEVLPLVEFVLAEGLSDEEATRLIESPPSAKEEYSSWVEDKKGDTQMLILCENKPDSNSLTINGSGDYSDDFSNEKKNDLYGPIVMTKEDLLELDPSEVLIRRWPKPLKFQFYRNVMPTFAVRQCNSCFRGFFLDDYEQAVVQKGHCPFCRDDKNVNEFVATEDL
ncbi:intraflagellar transport protein 122 homolog [Ischnura elegans]|uniref:intraflagellar transport protein 122 homolog n=1 Tax=Ischnura elegans TaxID=197161 RepID=UPI001ED8943E|nr:intraflagellar transport protein 122 homolog [Ischnura elegans]